MSEGIKVQKMKPPPRKAMSTKNCTDGMGLLEGDRQTPLCPRARKSSTYSSTETSVASEKNREKFSTLLRRTQLEEKQRSNKSIAKSSGDCVMKDKCVQSIEQKLLEKDIRKRDEYTIPGSIQGIHVAGKDKECSKQSVNRGAPARSLRCSSHHACCVGSKEPTHAIERPKDRERRKCGMNVKVVVEVRLRTL